MDPLAAPEGDITHTLQATALVGELYLKLAGKSYSDW
jgi:hypothetical protein